MSRSLKKGAYVDEKSRYQGHRGSSTAKLSGLLIK